MSLESWGQYPRARAQEARPAFSIHDRLPATEFLPRGLGRSYGDSCLISDGSLYLTRGLDRFRSFEHGVLTAEAGVSIAQLLEIFGPRGWFPPVTPGTKYVTLGGAVANDVHGKNHHVAGTFGRHVLGLTLRRSDGERLSCSREQNADMFHATIGGLGLTGVIETVTVRMMPVRGPYIDQETVAFSDLDGFFEINRASKAWPYTVAWVAQPTRAGDVRGIYIRGRHAETPSGPEVWRQHAGKVNVPFNLPGFCVNPLTVGALNVAYYWMNRLRAGSRQVGLDPFFYPLDAILHWNRMYGKRGFLQYQFVVPDDETGRTALRAVFARLANAPVASFLSVLKTFGDFAPEGLLSFPRPGITLAMDFPVKGEDTFRTLDDCDQIIARAGGAIYPAKDARMSGELFRRAYPRLDEFLKYKDPRLTSDLWRRVTS